MNKRIVCIIQARTGSTRLPNKIFLDLGGKPVLGRVIERLLQSTTIQKIVVACPDKPEDDRISDFVTKEYPTVGIFRGSEYNVLDRYYHAAKEYEADVVVRITSDCPVIDPVVVDRVVHTFLEKNVDYAANILGERTYPRGFDTEVFSFSCLDTMWKEAREEEDTEHVTLFLRKHPERFQTINVTGKNDYSQYRLTLDTEKDYEVLQHIYNNIPADFLDLDHISSYLQKNQSVVAINKDILQKYGTF